MDVYKIYESNDYDKIFEVLSTLKKLKTNSIFIEKYKDMSENPDFEQNQYSRTATSTYKIAHDGNRLMNWICYHDIF